MLGWVDANETDGVCVCVCVVVEMIVVQYVTIIEIFTCTSIKRWCTSLLNLLGTSLICSVADAGALL